jgi:hypothetical protein
MVAPHLNFQLLISVLQSIYTKYWSDEDKERIERKGRRKGKSSSEKGGHWFLRNRMERADLEKEMEIFIVLARK